MSAYDPKADMHSKSSSRDKRCESALSSAIPADGFRSKLLIVEFAKVAGIILAQPSVQARLPLQPYHATDGQEYRR
jgi:hypothetical protein